MKSDPCTCGRHPSAGVPLSVTALRVDGPMSLRDVTAATAKLMGHQLLYDDVLAVLERERKAGEVVRVSNGGDYRNHVWRALAPGEERSDRKTSSEPFRGPAEAAVEAARREAEQSSVPTLNAALVYKGDGDYNVMLAGPVVLELTYDGTDVMVGDWTFWAVRVGEHRFGGTSTIGPGPFHDWLEDKARASGHLPDEPERS